MMDFINRITTLELTTITRMLVMKNTRISGEIVSKSIISKSQRQLTSNVGLDTIAVSLNMQIICDNTMSVPLLQMIRCSILTKISILNDNNTIMMRVM